MGTIKKVLVNLAWVILILGYVCYTIWVFDSENRMPMVLWGLLSLVALIVSLDFFAKALRLPKRLPRYRYAIGVLASFLAFYLLAGVLGWIRL